MIFQIWSAEAFIAHTAIACDACAAIAPENVPGLDEGALLEAHLAAGRHGYRLVRVKGGRQAVASLCGPCGEVWDRAQPRPRRKVKKGRGEARA